MITKLICINDQLPRGITKIDFETACEELLWQYFEISHLICVYEGADGIGKKPTTPELRKLMKQFQGEVIRGEAIWNPPMYDL